MKSTLILVSSLAFASVANAQQPNPVKLPSPSPAASVSRTIGATQVTIDYSSPTVKGRKIWGELVPYGTPWRTGANATTALKITDPVKIAGKDVEAGTYGIWTIPTPDKWTVLLTKYEPQAVFNEKNELFRFEVKPEEAPMVEGLNFNIKGEGLGKATVTMHWEKLRITFPVEVDVVKEVKTALEKASPTDADAYRSAANFFYQNKLDQTQALAWIDKSIQIKEAPFSLALKAQILQRAGKPVDAVATMDKAISNAKADPNMKKEFLAELERIAAEIKSKPKS